MNIIDLLSSILNPNPGQNRLVAPNANGPNYLTQTGLGPEQLARFHQMSGMGGQAAPPQSVAPQQAQMPDQQQTASTPAAAPQGGGILSRLFGGGQNDGANQTIQWLQQQGMDQGTATMMANSKPALQEYLLKRSQGQKPEPRHTTTIDGKLIDTDTGQVVGDYGAPKEPKAPQIETLFDQTTGQEYKAQWNPKTQQYDRVGGLKADRGGLSVITNPDGTVSVTQGAAGRSMTEAQSKDTVFATKAAGSLPTIDKFGDALTSLPESVGGQIPVVGNYMKSAEYQQAEQAGREFIAAILRKESGAAISIPERNEYGGIYLPEPGDKPPLLEQKRAARARALEAIKAGMPPAAILAQERALAAGGKPPAPGGVDPSSDQGNDTPPASYTGKNWKYLTPEQRKLWQ